jgi:hypothetical protein
LTTNQTSTLATKAFHEILKLIPLLKPNSSNYATIHCQEQSKWGHLRRFLRQMAWCWKEVGPSKMTNPLVQIKARWAPKDSYVLKSLKAQIITRLTPLLSTFNKQHSWMIEWQTNQSVKKLILSPFQRSTFLAIACLTMLLLQLWSGECNWKATCPGSTIERIKNKRKQNVVNTSLLIPHLVRLIRTNWSS